MSFRPLSSVNLLAAKLRLYWDFDRTRRKLNLQGRLRSKAAKASKQRMEQAVVTAGMIKTIVDIFPYLGNRSRRMFEMQRTRRESNASARAPP